MKEDFPSIYKTKINNLKTKVQNEYYFHDEREKVHNTPVTKSDIMKKIDDIFSSNNFVYQADVIIMFKNGDIKQKKIIAAKENYILTIDNEKILYDDIVDIK